MLLSSGPQIGARRGIRRSAPSRSWRYGTAVFPDADLKVFLVADPWERARRRLVQRLTRRPTDQEIAEETERLVRRDAADATQTMQARDAVLIDTTALTQTEQVERIVALARAIRMRRPLTPPHGGGAQG